MNLFRCSAVLVPGALLLLSGCKQKPPSNVAAMVNNRPITFAELDRQVQLQFPASGENLSEDEARIRRLEVLRTMIDNEIMLQRAEKLGLMAVDTDVEQKLIELRAPYTPEKFQQELQNKKMTLDDLRKQIRQDLSIQKLLNKEITAYSTTVTEKEIADFYNANRNMFNLAEPQIHMAQIVVTPRPDPNVRNLQNSKAQNEDQARKKIQEIEARISKGEPFDKLAQNYSEDPQTAPNGGDLGFVPESALEKADPELRRMILQIAPGQVSNIVRTAEGYRIFRVISKEPAGQRELSDPRVQQNIREALTNRRDQLLKAAYYEVARNEAKVTNYLAIEINREKERRGQ